MNVFQDVFQIYYKVQIHFLTINHDNKVAAIMIVNRVLEIRLLEYQNQCFLMLVLRLVEMLHEAFSEKLSSFQGVDYVLTYITAVTASSRDELVCSI